MPSLDSTDHIKHTAEVALFDSGVKGKGKRYYNLASSLLLHHL